MAQDRSSDEHLRGTLVAGGGEEGSRPLVEGVVSGGGKVRPACRWSLLSEF